MSTIDITNTAKTYREIQAEIKTLQEQADALKQLMICEMDAKQADSIQAGEYTIRQIIYESLRVDTGKLKAAGLYEQFATVSTAIRFQVA